MKQYIMGVITGAYPLASVAMSMGDPAN
ncbi:uncharacterized protein METZ01_LOCUS149779 [marine metagenome]|uniref:Uncharacterized protein n=1 Tax=marine metagenome TaxID=408172 RepID=A0A382A5V2_9ZZZZ